MTDLDWEMFNKFYSFDGPLKYSDVKRAKQVTCPLAWFL